jgi:predicted nucleic acid-binding protein
MKWMLDTDTCIAIIKRSSGSAIKKLRGKSIGQVGMSAISLGELSFGAAKSARRDEAFEALAQFVLALEVAAFDGEAASHYGSVRALLAKRGTPARTTRYIDRRPRLRARSHTGYAQHTRVFEDQGFASRGLGRLSGVPSAYQ